MKTYLSYALVFLILLSTLTPVFALTDEEIQAQIAANNAELDQKLADFQDEFDAAKEAQENFDVDSEISETLGTSGAAAGATAGVAVGVFSLFFIFIGLLAIVSIIAFIWALMDILKSNNDTNWKLLWVVICILLGILGVIIYYFVGRKDRVSEKPASAGKPKKKKRR